MRIDLWMFWWKFWKKVMCVCVYIYIYIGKLPLWIVTIFFECWTWGRKTDWGLHASLHVSLGLQKRLFKKKTKSRQNMYRYKLMEEIKQKQKKRLIRTFPRDRHGLSPTKHKLDYEFWKEAGPMGFQFKGSLIWPVD